MSIQRTKNAHHHRKGPRDVVSLANLHAVMLAATYGAQCALAQCSGRNWKSKPKSLGLRPQMRRICRFDAGVTASLCRSITTPLTFLPCVALMATSGRQVSDASPTQRRHPALTKSPASTHDSCNLTDSQNPLCCRPHRPLRSTLFPATHKLMYNITIIIDDSRAETIQVVPSAACVSAMWEHRQAQHICGEMAGTGQPGQ